MPGTLQISALVAACVLMAACSEAQDSSAPAKDASATPPAQAAASTQATGTLDGSTFADFSPDPARGKALFLQCQTCHALDPGQNRIGPSLAGIVGRQAGSLPGYAYSAANRNARFAWTEDKLFQFLEKPRHVMPGTKMVYAGLAKPQDRADLIAYLKSNGGT